MGVRLVLAGVTEKVLHSTDREQTGRTVRPLGCAKSLI